MSLRSLWKNKKGNGSIKEERVRKAFREAVGNEEKEEGWRREWGGKGGGREGG